jgi:dsRNA-specific ribonuclease
LKIKFEVISESGPPHAKTFEVKLSLIDSQKDSVVESYSSKGSSINKAKASAGETAIKETKLEKPTDEDIKNKKNGKLFSFLFFLLIFMFLLI